GACPTRLGLAYRKRLRGAQPSRVLAFPPRVPRPFRLRYGNGDEMNAALRPQPALRDADQCVPCRLRFEHFPPAEQSDGVAVVTGVRDVLPGEPVDALQVERPALGEQIAVCLAERARLALVAALEGDDVGVVLRAPAHLCDVERDPVVVGDRD